MQNCLIIANCQGDIFRHVLSKHPEFSKDWKVEYFANFVNPTIPESSFENCDLLIYQKLGVHFKELSEVEILKKVNPNAKKIVMPNLRNFCLWPTAKWSTEFGPIWEDSYLEDLLTRNLTLEETVYFIMKTDFSKLFDLEEMAKNSLNIEYEKNFAWRDEIIEFTGKNWKKKQLFTTPSHPANDLVELMANLFFKELGYKELIFDKRIALLCCSAYFLPIHPFFKKYYNIKWLEDNAIFPVHKNKLNYLEYASTYIKAKKSNVPIFYAFNFWEK